MTISHRMTKMDTASQHVARRNGHDMENAHIDTEFKGTSPQLKSAIGASILANIALIIFLSVWSPASGAPDASPGHHSPSEPLVSVRLLA